MITSGLLRTLETARIVAHEREPESWPELREIESGRLGDIPEDELERAFLEAWRDVVPEEARFLGGETIGSLLDRVLPAIERLLAALGDHAANHEQRLADEVLDLALVFARLALRHETVERELPAPAYAQAPAQTTRT